jgi:hypothetical protein
VSGPTGRGGTGRVGIVENWELRQDRQQDANSGAFKGIVFVVVAIGLIVVGGWYAARPMIGPTVESVFEDNPGIANLPLVQDLLAAEFADRLDSPAGAGDMEIAFVIQDGQSVSDIQASLVEAGLLTDESAFNYAVVRDRVDQLIKPGTYTMTPRITPAGIAARLKGDPDPPIPMITLDMRPGRRIEQTVAYLQQEVERGNRLRARPQRVKATRTQPFQQAARGVPIPAGGAGRRQPRRLPVPGDLRGARRHHRRRADPPDAPDVGRAHGPVRGPGQEQGLRLLRLAHPGQSRRA